jgi:hypothetical protein
MTIPYAREFFEQSVVVETDDCILWPFNTNRGYGVVRINGIPTYVHCRAALLRYGPPPMGLECAHSCKNRNCFNYRHISYKSHSENLADRKRDGTENFAVGEQNGTARLTERHVHWVRRQLDLGSSVREISTYLKVPYSTINNIRRGSRWKWLPRQDIREWRDLV